jgi:peptide/nickel transport system permease protein
MTSATLRHAGWILRGNPVTAVAAAGVFLLTLIAIFGPWIVPMIRSSRTCRKP